MSQGRSGSTRISNVNRLACDSPAALHAAIELGASRRAVGSHKLNAESSRSHQVVQLELHRTCQAPSASAGAGNGAGAGGAVVQATDRTVVAVLNLVDLAGSERVRRTGVSGERLKEAQHINRSLSALGDVIASLKRASRSDASGAHVHVPFRNAKLTHLLRDSLMGDSKVRAATLPHLWLLVACVHTRRCLFFIGPQVLMFVTVSPLHKDLSETLCSLQFAARCRSVALRRGNAYQHVSSSVSTRLCCTTARVVPLTAGWHLVCITGLWCHPRQC